MILSKKPCNGFFNCFLKVSHFKVGKKNIDRKMIISKIQLNKILKEETMKMRLIFFVLMITMSIFLYANVNQEIDQVKENKIRIENIELTKKIFNEQMNNGGVSDKKHII